MKQFQAYIVTVIERTRHTLSVVACSVAAVVELLSDTRNPGITLVDQTLLDLQIAEIQDLGGDNRHHGKEVEQ
jgi:hypothetical protein